MRKSIMYILHNTSQSTFIYPVVYVKEQLKIAKLYLWIKELIKYVALFISLFNPHFIVKPS